MLITVGAISLIKFSPDNSAVGVIHFSNSKNKHCKLLFEQSASSSFSPDNSDVCMVVTKKQCKLLFEN
jgi:hypothetical protein